MNKPAAMGPLPETRRQYRAYLRQAFYLLDCDPASKDFMKYVRQALVAVDRVDNDREFVYRAVGIFAEYLDNLGTEDAKSEAELLREWVIDSALSN